jgi:GH24 family phage-related lysozyme (muramidase)
MDRTAALERLKKFEGCVPHMYRCTGGEVTIGIGHALPTASDAAKLMWQIADRAATASEIGTDFEKVRSAELGMLASRYAPLTTCRMADDAIAQLAAADIESFEARLAAALPRWNSYPEPAQQALFDMAFNLGIGGLLKFRRLQRAVDAGDWDTASRECHRMGIAEARNRETAELFLKSKG